jgi:hypothetical protein
MPFWRRTDHATPVVRLYTRDLSGSALGNRTHEFTSQAGIDRAVS